MATTTPSSLEIAQEAKLRPITEIAAGAGLEPDELDLYGEVPTDSAVREAVQKRQLLLLSLPGSAAAKGVGATAERLSSGTAL